MSVAKYIVYNFVIICFEFAWINNIDTKFEKLIPRHKLDNTFSINKY